MWGLWRLLYKIPIMNINMSTGTTSLVYTMTKIPLFDRIMWQQNYPSLPIYHFLSHCWWWFFAYLQTVFLFELIISILTLSLCEPAVLLRLRQEATRGMFLCHYVAANMYLTHIHCTGSRTDVYEGLFPLVIRNRIAGYIVIGSNSDPMRQWLRASVTV